MGKTHAAAIELILGGLKVRGVYAYVAPEKDQGVRAVWKKFEDILSGIPGVGYNRAKSFITLPNGSDIYILGGASGPERIRGIHPKGLVIDEVADMPYDFWWGSAYGSLQVHKGWCLFIGTPKGEDLFFDLYKNYGLNSQRSDWAALKIDVKSSGLFSEAEILQMEKDTPKDQWEREFLCMFTGTLGGSYYNQIINDLWEREQIGHFPYQSNRPVVAAFDIGIVDKTALWIAQEGANGRINVIDFFEDTNQDTYHWMEYLRSLQYQYHAVFLPHDSKKRSPGTKGHSPRELFINHGFRVQDVPKTNSVVDDIAAVRSKLYNCTFDDNSRVLQGLAHLRSYESSRDRFTGEYNKEPKTSSPHRDAADAFRYLVLGWKPIAASINIPTKVGFHNPIKFGRKTHGSRLR